MTAQFLFSHYYASHLRAKASSSRRWSDAAQQLSESLENVVGDVLIAAAVVAYLGVFTVDYREVSAQGTFFDTCLVKSG